MSDLEKRITRRWLSGSAIPERVYHATPYPDSILRNGFELRSDQTFGGHEAEYVSGTTFDNARFYARGLRTVIDLVGLEIDWLEMRERLKREFGASDRGWKKIFALSDDIFPRPQFPDDWRERFEHVGEVRRHFAVRQKTDDGRPTGRTEEKSRRFALISNLYSLDADFPLFSISTADPPMHLSRLSAADVGIVEAEVRREAELSEQGWVPGEGIAGGNVTYNAGETEWRFWNPELLVPVDVIRSF